MDRNNAKTIIYIVSIFLLIVSVSISLYSAKNIFYFQPTTTDEGAYVFQSKLFLNGKIFVEPFIIKEFFWTEMLITTEKWLSRYAPGHSILLMPGVLFHFNNLIPILISGFTVVLIYLIILKITKNLVLAFISGITAISSPFFILMSGTLLSHTSLAFFVVLYVYIFIKNIENNFKNNFSAFLLGAVWAFGFIIRQYSSLLITLPFVIYHFFMCIRHKHYKNFILFILGSVPFVLLLCYYNYIGTGNPLLQTYSYYSKLYAPEHKLGFGLSYNNSLFTPFDAIKILKTNIVLFNKWLFGIPLSITIVFVSIILSKNNKWKILFMASIFMLIVGYFFFYFPGLPWFGSNYYYEIIPIIVILVFINIHSLYVNKKAILCAAVIILIPFYVFYYPGFFRQISKNIQINTSELVLFADMIKEKGIHNAILFVPETTRIKSPGTLLINNSPFLDDDVLVANDMYDNNFLLMLRFPERKFYRIYFSGERESSVIVPIDFARPVDKIVEFNSAFGAETGKKVIIKNSDKFIVYARKNVDTSGSLLYGPYWKLPAGSYECVFYIKAAKGFGSNPVVKIDVSADFGKQVMAEKILTGNDFRNSNWLYKFPMRFSINNTAEIETRVYFYGNANVFIRKIRFREIKEKYE
jgi:hypothetical protein